MRKFLAILILTALVAPAALAAAPGLYFNVTGDGSFDCYRDPSNGEEGYTNGGSLGFPRLSKANQHEGWMSFLGATEMTTQQSLVSYVAANPGATAILYVRSGNALMPAGNAGSYVVSIRSGNVGGIVEDQDADGYGGQGYPADGITGTSQLQAFRECAPLVDLNGNPFYQYFGSGIYTNNNPNLGGGVPWIRPAEAAANAGRIPCQSGPGTAVQYDKGLVEVGTANGKMIGWFNDTWDGRGRNFWALEDLVGIADQRGYGTTTWVQNAGQIMLGGIATPTLVNSSMYVPADPKTGTDNWLAIPVDAAFLADLGRADGENKGILFANNFAGLDANWSNSDFWSKEQSGGEFQAYLYIPEPASMLLLALGGLAMLRRRS
jgi:hypothetical protein